MVSSRRLNTLAARTVSVVNIGLDFQLVLDVKNLPAFDDTYSLSQHASWRWMRTNEVYASMDKCMEK